MATDTTRDDSELLIFSRFSRAFVHVVRGDLSVITNEVSYLATKMPPEELSRARNRCSQMAATISKIAGLHTELSLHVVGSEVVARSFGAVLSRNEDEFVTIDNVKIERLASSVRQMFPTLDVAWTAHRTKLSGLTLSLHVPGHTSATGSSSVQYRSWSAFACRELGERSVIDAVVADLIMRAHGWTLTVEALKDELRVLIHIPFASTEQRTAKCA